MRIVPAWSLHALLVSSKVAAMEYGHRDGSIAIAPDERSDLRQAELVPEADTMQRKHLL